MSDLASLIGQHAIAERTWTPATDGLANDIARDIKTELARVTGLDDSKVSYLLENIL